MITPDNIEEVLAKYFSGNCDSDERKAIDVWRNQSVQNDKEFIAFKMAWDLTGSSENFDSKPAWKRVKKKLEFDQNERGISIFRNNGFKIAAAISLVFTTALLLFKSDLFLKSKEMNFSAGQTIETHMLPDQSVVTLKQGSRIGFVENFNTGKRVAKLEGSAFFEVKRNEQMPFFVETRYGTVQVLGTSFLVQEDTIENVTLVHVESGRVLVFPDDDPLKGIEITIHESANVSPGQVRKIQIGNTNIIAWKSRRIRFMQSELPVVFKDLENIYGMRIDFKTQDFQNCLFTGKFSDLELETILFELSEIYHFEYSFEGKRVVISGGGC